MSSTGNILHASIGGSVELLALSGAGAALAHLGHFTSTVSSNLSKTLYKLFIPSLIFGSVLDTVHNAVQQASAADGDPAALQDLWFPVVLAFAVFLVSGLIAFPLTYLIARRKEEAVRRAIFVCLTLGNANTMPLLVMQSLCNTFEPLQEGGKCYTKAMGYASLYMTVVNIVTWTALFQYLLYSPDSSEGTYGETQSLLESGTRSKGKDNTTSQINASSEGSENRLREAINKALLSPPFLTVILASTLAMIPNVPQVFLSSSGALQPLLLSTNTLGQCVVPISCMIVGAELYRSFQKQTSGIPGKEDLMLEEERFGRLAVLVIIFVRMMLLPYIGRVLYSVLGLHTGINSPQLGVFALSQWNVPTANNTVIMISIVADSLPRIGRQLRADASRCLFWQFLTTPIFLTLNTAEALRLQFS